MQIITDHNMNIPVKKDTEYRTRHKTEVSGHLRRQIVDVETVTDTRDKNTVIFNIHNVFEETLPVKIHPKSIIPPAVFSELEMISGKIRARISDLPLKQQLLREIAGIKQLLHHHKIVAAMIVLRTIAAKVQIPYNPCHQKVPVNLILKGISSLEQQLASLLFNCKKIRL